MGEEAVIIKNVNINVFYIDQHPVNFDQMSNFGRVPKIVNLPITSLKPPVIFRRLFMVSLEEGFEPSSWQSSSWRNMCLKGGLFRERG